MRTTGEERTGAALEVVLGVDTHLDVHVAVALRPPWQAPGCADLGDECEGLRGTPLVGTGARPGEVRRGGGNQQLRGLKLARHLKSKGIEVLEVERPKRRQQGSRRNGKPDHADAEAAARAVLAGEAAGMPKSALTARWRRSACSGRLAGRL